MTGLIRYDERCCAIEACHAVDEVKGIRDKALAFQHYVRQAQDLDSERKCVQIRLPAERKAGRMLKKMEKAPGGRPVEYRSPDVAGSADGPPTLAEMGILKKQSADWQQLAEVPDDRFEAALAGIGAPPSTAGILPQHAPKPDKPAPPPAPPGFVQATQAIGRFRDYAEYCLENDPEFVAAGRPWLDSFSRHLRESA